MKHSKWFSYLGLIYCSFWAIFSLYWIFNSIVIGYIILHSICWFIQISGVYYCFSVLIKYHNFKENFIKMIQMCINKIYFIFFNKGE